MEDKAKQIDDLKAHNEGGEPKPRRVAMAMVNVDLDPEVQTHQEDQTLLVATGIPFFEKPMSVVTTMWIFFATKKQMNGLE
jgi:hypothetical protein